MCGIFGYLDHSGTLSDSNLLSKMSDLLAHRGPDGSGSFKNGTWGLGNTRLAILDVANGQQPFLSEDEQIIVVQNGEIFNYLELGQELARKGTPCRTQCDTEVLLRLYESEGIDFVKKLNGMFAIAICDLRLQKLYLIRDRIGEKPLYLFQDDNKLVFSSEIKALFMADVPRSIDYDSLNHFLTYNYAPPPRTFFKGIRHVKPGTIVEITERGVTEQRWWDLTEQQPETFKESDWIEQFNFLLDDAVKIRLRSDVPFGAFLSGGIDSTSVLASMTKHLDKPVSTFCIGFHEKSFDESRFAQQAAAKFVSNHTMERVRADMFNAWPTTIYHCDQPHGDVSFLPMRRVSQLAASQVKMVLTGDGADELFAGYDKHKNFFEDNGTELPDQIFRTAYYKNISLFDNSEKNNLLSAHARSNLSEPSSEEMMKTWLDKCKHMDQINQALMLDMQLLLPGNNLVKPDRMAMSTSLETRAPFLDYRMMEFAFRTPGELKLKNSETKYLYKKAVAPLIGNELTYRKKQMFTVPIGHWLQNQLAEVAREFLISPRTRERSLFDYDLIKTMFEKHKSGEENHTRQLRALMAVEIWHRLFIDDFSTSPPALTEL